MNLRKGLLSKSLVSIYIARLIFERFSWKTSFVTSYIQALYEINVVGGIPSRIFRESLEL